MNSQDYSNVVDKYMLYLNEKNPEGITALYADTATVEDPVGSNVVSGIAAIREFYSKIVDFDLNVKRTGPIRIAGKEVAFQLFMKFSGSSTKTDVIDTFHFDEVGKILSMRAFWGEKNQSPH